MSKYVIDTASLVSLGISRIFQELSRRLDLHTTQIVVNELRDIAARDDTFAKSATKSLKKIDKEKVIKSHQVDLSDRFMHGAIDRGESSCIDLARKLDADYLVTDDHRASHAMKDYLGDKIVFSPILIKALVLKGIIAERTAVEELKVIARTRNWFDSPLYQYALELFGESE